MREGGVCLLNVQSKVFHTIVIQNRIYKRNKKKKKLSAKQQCAIWDHTVLFKICAFLHLKHTDGSTSV